MKFATATLAALVLSGMGALSAAQAQGVPQGSYLRSCDRAHVEGDTLIAHCRRVDGGGQRTALGSVSRCTGDISNSNGNLACGYGGGPGRAQGPAVGPGPQQAFNPGGGGERCHGLRREAEHLRGRLDSEWNPMERARLEGRLREVREEQHRCDR